MRCAPGHLRLKTHEALSAGVPACVHMCHDHALHNNLWPQFFSASQSPRFVFHNPFNPVSLSSISSRGTNTPWSTNVGLNEALASVSLNIEYGNEAHLTLRLRVGHIPVRSKERGGRNLARSSRRFRGRWKDCKTQRVAVSHFLWVQLPGFLCKYHTSNDKFPWCKTCAQKTTGKSYDELPQHDNKMRIWTRSGKFRKVENQWLGDKAQRERQ